MENTFELLDERQQNLTIISAYAAAGKINQLKEALNTALDAGMNINEIKEALVHIYAYCGFPPSILAVNTFKAIVEERKANGIKDELGRDNSAIPTDLSRYERGEKAQMLVTGFSAEKLKELFDFAPVMDVFLKEHLFSDLFDRDILDYVDREIVTVAVLASIHHPFVRSHIGGALNVGMTESQLKALFSIIEETIGKAQADTSRQILAEVVDSRK